MAKKSSKHNPDPDIETPDETPSPNQVKKKRKAEGEQQVDTSTGEPLKKRKKHRRDAMEEAEKDTRDATAEAPPKKKRHKNRTGLADPREDTVLSNQARKGLEYAFLQFHRPSKWKFNKARQNWIIRNVWSAENVPEMYLPLVIKYLTNVQGGSRTKLIETCQSILDKPHKPEAENPEEKPALKVHVPAPLPVEVAAVGDERARAQTLLDVLALPTEVQ
ncbi:hypothetical protein K443DRAFT_85301 [Laccaria amethystina LaAM-08-1]|uniref:WKF domain-containing protein n=1 Tax=Laccaria amethystina LaAM-08-1 TaxID=1095629 RepID=A0A0C9XUB2_9AGAR|nr:hypothetical protein K443DRAFT_85301 [Laccaria amethystina LaAM-08-1]